MAEPIILTDLEFRFTHGDPLYATVQEGRDAIEDVKPCTHCGRSGTTLVTVRPDPSTESTITIHADKLNGMVRTRTVVQPEPPADPYASVDISGRTIEE